MSSREGVKPVDPAKVKAMELGFPCFHMEYGCWMLVDRICIYIYTVPLVAIFLRPGYVLPIPPALAV